MTSYQERFHQTWGSLCDQHVRSLAWLLTAPQLLAPSAMIEAKQIAQIHLPPLASLTQWLHDLDQQPAAFHAALQLHRYRRLGHYAENLLRFFFNHTGELLECGLQVHQNQSATVGEFDFLLRDGDGIAHLEMATKFYLFYQASHVKTASQSERAPDLFDFLGPNLADTLGVKIEKIVHQQLKLSAHPAAQQILPQGVCKAQVLMKGWLFYRDAPSPAPAPTVTGVASEHCRGHWWTYDDLLNLTFETAKILPKLQWLAPARVQQHEGEPRQLLLDNLAARLATDQTPVMLALLRDNGEYLEEVQRGMVVSNDWMARADTRSLN